MRARVVDYNKNNGSGLIYICENKIGEHTQYLIDEESKKALNLVLDTKNLEIIILSRFKKSKVRLLHSQIHWSKLSDVIPGLYYVAGNHETKRMIRISGDESMLISNIDSGSRISSLTYCSCCYNDSGNIHPLYQVGELIYPWFKFKKTKPVAYCTCCSRAYFYKRKSTRITKLVI